MRHLLVIILLAATLSVPAHARKKTPAQPDDPLQGLPEAPTLKFNAYRGYSWALDENGDSTVVFHLKEFTVYRPLKFKNKKEEDCYWRTVRYVRLSLPYAKMIAETLIETYEYLETFGTQKEREDYLKQMEKALFEQYKPVLKKF